MAFAISLKPRWMWGLLLALAVLLPVLAALQYRWISVFSEHERMHLTRTLRTGTLRFSDEVNRLLEGIHQAFFLDTLPPAEYVADTLAGRIRRWRAMTSHPDLIGALFLVRFDASEVPVLLRLDADTGTLTPIAWPDSLRPWADYFEQIAARHRVASPTPETLQIPALPPALPVPLLDELRLDAASAAAMLAAPPPDHVLVLIDTSYLTDRLLPALVKQHFSDDHGLAYDVLIRSLAEPAQVVYRSTPSPNENTLSPPDLSTPAGQFRWLDVAAYRLGDAAGRYVTRVRRDTTYAALALRLLDGGFLDGRNAARQFSLDPTLMDDDRREVRTGPASVSSGTEVMALDQELMTEAMPLPARREGGKAWQLVLRHRAGSIEAAAQAVRKRTLGLGFGIVLLLALAAWLLAAAAQRARRLADQQMAFVAGVSHELRTPLAVIRSAAENLADGLVRNDEQARRYGRLIDQEGLRLSEMIEHTLALAGAQSDARYAFQAEAVAPLVDRALEQGRPVLGQIEVARVIAPDLPRIYADTQAMEAALRNLLGNAVKHGARHVTVEVRPTTNGRSRQVLIAVHDDGPGVPADELPHLFEPFFRGRAARARQTAGSGVGLSVVRRTVEAHGGRVTVRSVPGRGSTFILHLPALDV